MVNPIPCYDEFLMAKFKPVKKGGNKEQLRNPGAFGCVIVVLSGIALLSVLFFWVLSSGK